jgi:hypothetical protein
MQITAPQDRRNLQTVLGCLMTNEDFLRSFRDDPEQAVASLGLELTPFEYSMADAFQARLQSVPDEGAEQN